MFAESELAWRLVNSRRQDLCEIQQNRQRFLVRNVLSSSVSREARLATKHNLRRTR